MTFIRDKCPKLEISKENSSYYVSVREVDVDVLHDEIIKMIEKNGGSIDNLSVVYDSLKKKYPDFDLKDYGYSRISSFLRSMPEIIVKENAVSLKDTSKENKKK